MEGEDEEGGWGGVGEGGMEVVFTGDLCELAHGGGSGEVSSMKSRGMIIWIGAT